MAKSRDDFPKPIADALGKRASFICSNPDCRILTVGPSEEDESKFLYVGKAAHICAAAERGPRYSAAMTPQQRASGSNGIFLCSVRADMIDKNGGVDFTIECLENWKDAHEKWVAQNLNRRAGSIAGVGGDGGGGTVEGDRGTIIGGRGGDGGAAGKGGRGGSGFIRGSDGLIFGGSGGNAATADGRGGRGAPGPTERLGLPTDFWVTVVVVPEGIIRNTTGVWRSC